MLIATCHTVLVRTLHCAYLTLSNEVVGGGAKLLNIINRKGHPHICGVKWMCLVITHNELICGATTKCIVLWEGHFMGGYEGMGFCDYRVFPVVSVSVVRLSLICVHVNMYTSKLG